MNKPMRVLIITTNGFGHINIGLGIADLLARNGHKPCFLLKHCYKEKILTKNHEFIPLEDNLEDSEQDHGLVQMKALDGMKELLKRPTIEQLEVVFDLENFSKEHRMINDNLKKVLITQKFDLLIAATLLALPEVETSGKPWIFFHTPSPHLLYKNHVLPFSGYSENTPKELKEQYRKRFDELYKLASEQWSSYLIEHGAGPVNLGYMARESPYLNIYAYPEVLDFRDQYPLPDHFFRMDSAIREDDGTEFIIPESFLNREGRLVYVALGSWFSGLVEVMKNLISILSKSPHKFIVSRGPNYDKYELAENMWGEKFLNQLKVLPMVDAVITHGGNNSTVECLYFGKPMIVLPCFVDQHDNASRIDEKGLGIKMQPFDLKEEKLLAALEKLLNDTETQIKARHVSEQLKNSKTREKVVQFLETIAQNKCPFSNGNKDTSENHNGLEKE